MANIFRQALEVLDTKNGDMTKDEQELLSAAMIPLLLLPEYNDVDLREGLAELAWLVENNDIQQDQG